MAYFRTTTSKGNKYLQFVESYRNQKKQSATRVLSSLGNISNKSDEEIEAMTISFIRVMGLESKFCQVKFEAGTGYHYGTILPVIALWEKLGMNEIINNAISEKVKIPVAQISLIQTANRFSCPSSKLACYRWYYNSLFSEMKNFVKFPDHREEQLHTYYRSLDYLCSAKEEIEQDLYYRLRQFGMDTSLILYDITSSYFEGSQSEIGELGYSRDHRSDAEQIVIGLVMSRDGIPVAHHVFEGNRVDKTTVKEVVSDLKKRFGITNAIFVGDKGMLTLDNIEDIKDQDYDYILGLQSRNRKVIRDLIEKVCIKKWKEITDITIDNLRGKIIEEKKFNNIKSLKNEVFNQEELKKVLKDFGISEKEIEIILPLAEEPAKTIQEFDYNDLSRELKKEYSEKIRFIACYNSKIAFQVKKTRKKNLKNFKELVRKTKKVGELDKVKQAYHKLKSFLARKHMTKFYNLEIKPVYQPLKWRIMKNRKKVNYNFWGNLFYLEEQETFKTNFLANIAGLYSLPLHIFQDDEIKEGYTLKIKTNKEKISYEEKLDGRYFIQTEVSKKIEKETINQSYKSLAKVERAFRVVKDEFDIRPINVRKETRIKGHVMICYLALVIESLIEKKIKELFPESYKSENYRDVIQSVGNGEEPLTMMTLSEQLDTIRMLPLQISSAGNKNQKPIYISTKIGNNVKKLFKSLGIKNANKPEKLSFNSDQKKRDDKQLLMNFGGGY